MHQGVITLLLGLLSSVRADKKVNVREVVVDSAVSDVMFCGTGDNKAILLVTKSGRLYRTENDGVNWKDLTGDDMFKVESGGSGITTEMSVANVEVHKNDPNVVLAQGNDMVHFVSDSGGKHWRMLKQRATIHKIIFHPTRSHWLLLSSWTDGCKKDANTATNSQDSGPCNHMLFVSKDLGRSFSLVCTYVVQFSWGSKIHNQEDRIYFSHFRQKTGDQPKLTMWSKTVDFVHTEDFGQTVHRLIYRGNKFGVLDSFIFVAKLKDSEEQTVNLYVSSDGGKTFNIVRMPEDLAEKSYTILDTSEEAVILHVNHGSSDGVNVGNVYISDPTGSRYTLSLQNNIREDSGECEFDSVASVKGIYIANYIHVDNKAKEDALKQEANSKTELAGADQADEEAAGVGAKKVKLTKGRTETNIRTVITFDKGGEWRFLKPPKVDSLGKPIECQPDRCWLHLHGATGKTLSPFYSTSSSLGLIMATGNVGSSLRMEPDQANTYISRDGGLTWSEAHKGAFTYEFGDHGGLAIMAHSLKATTEIVFSWNEGQSWYDFQLGTQPGVIANIVTEPGSTSIKFIVLATRDDSGVVYNLDFKGLQQPACKGVWAADSVSSDYETWSPSDGQNRESCLLGRKITFTRRKPSSECFNGVSFERPTTVKACSCAESDYECELGFVRPVDSLECRLMNAELALPDDCNPGSTYTVPSHRKVAGDSCEGGWQPPQISVSCPGKSPFTRSALYVLFTIAMIIVLMMTLQFLTQHHKYKHIFANFGFDNFSSVKYDKIGEDCGPETALESVGTRYDADFIQDDYEEDAPRLVSYEREMRQEEVRRLDTAAAHVPALSMPAGSAKIPEVETTEDLL